MALVGSLALAALLLAISAHAYIGFFSRYNADDYCFAQLARSSGFFAAQKDWYMHWRGVFSHTAAISLASFAGPRLVSYLPSAVLSLWLLGLSWTIREIALTVGFRRPYLMSILLAEVIVFGTVYTAPNIVQSLYWQSGMFSYAAPIPFLVAYIGLVAYNSRRSPYETSPIALVSSVALPFVAGGFSETYLAAQTSGLFLAVVLAFLLKGESFRRTSFRLILGGFAGSTLALAVVVMAPGNAVRESFFPSPPSVLSLIGHSVYFTLRFIRISVLASPLMIILSVVGPAFLMFVSHLRKDLARPRSPDGSKWSARWMLILPAMLGFVVIAFSLAPSVYADTDFPPLRAWIVPEFIFVCALVFWGTVVGLTLRARRVANKSLSAESLILPSALIVALLTLAPLASARRILSLAPQVREYASSWDDRDVEMRDAKLKGKRDLIVPALGYTGGLEDLSHDPKHSPKAPNYCIAHYYGLDSVLAERPSTKDFPMWLTSGNTPYWMK